MSKRQSQQLSDHKFDKFHWAMVVIFFSFVMSSDPSEWSTISAFVCVINQDFLKLWVVRSRGCLIKVYWLAPQYRQMMVYKVRWCLNGRHFADDIVTCISGNENWRVLNKTSLICIPEAPYWWYVTIGFIDGYVRPTVWTNVDKDWRCLMAPQGKTGLILYIRESSWYSAGMTANNDCGFLLFMTSLWK